MKPLSRRDFLKNASAAIGVAAAGATALGLAGCDTGDSGGTGGTGNQPTGPAGLPGTWEAETDIIIVGAGAAGLAAGITVADEGLGQAIILEAAPEGFEGGNSRTSAQIMFIPDDVNGAVTYQTNLNGDYVVEKELLEAWATELVQNVEWMNSFDADMDSIPLFAPEYPDVAGSETAKTYCIKGGMGGLGNAYAWQFLRDTAKDLNVDIRFEARVTSLIFDSASKEVFGVTTADGKNYKANKGVILACGGFENNPDMMRNYYTIGFPGVGFVGSPFNRGDGITMAQQVGAELWHMNNFAGPYFGTRTVDEAGLPTDVAKSNMILYNPSFRDKDFIFLGVDGRRYMNEDTFGQARHGKVMRAGTYVTMPTPTPGWCIIGPKTFAAGDIYGASTTSWTSVIDINLAKTNQLAVDNGIFTKCDSVADIARVTGLTEAALQATLNKWNSCCDAGYDPEFHRGEDFFDTVGTHGASTTEEGKPAIPAYPIERLDGPYYVFSLIGGILNSQGGPKRNIKGQIIDLNGDPIPRLYGSGELGCVYAYMYNGGGNLSEAISSGRFAARNVGALSGWDLPVPTS